jgi:glucokinase
MAVNLNLDAPLPLRDMLADRLNGSPSVTMENDVRTAALGAYRWLRQREDLTHMAYLSVGTGIAAGLILEGTLYRGTRGLAGEIGHVVVQPDGPRCQCGARGCLETLAAGPAISRLSTPHFDPTGNNRPPTSAEVYRQARQGHVGAQEVVAQTAQYLAQAIHWLVMAYDVEKVLIGGGVTRAGDAFLQPLIHYFADLRARSRLARFMMPETFMTLLPAGYDAGTWGAIALAQQALEGHSKQLAVASRQYDIIESSRD